MLELGQYFSVLGGIPLVSQLRQQDSRGAEPAESCENPSPRCYVYCLVRKKPISLERKLWLQSFLL